MVRGKLKLGLYVYLMGFVFYEICSHEDWGVDELIVEDSWKKQVGGD